ncbi:hypothetical protein Syun_030197 [Stephania yunnanensis]|uniref:Uncharacterized protein n=1 Tax=Stephania yunnanensis TaxID=152371 RepID=A0AAP0EEL6_9MAGN
MVGSLHSRRESIASSSTTFWSESSEQVQGGTGGGAAAHMLELIEFPFGAVEGLDRDDLREAAYEVFFTACRSSPGFGGRNALSFYSTGGENGEGGGGGTPRSNNVMGGIVGASKIKRALGLKSAKRLMHKKSSLGTATSAATPSPSGSPHGSDETLVLDEVDELLELMKKTWPILGINKFMHNVCFTWIFFQQYIATGQVEQDLLGASLAVLAEVTNDVKKSDKEQVYGKILSVAMNSIQSWSDQKLLSYHENFQSGGAGLMENILPLTLSATKIINEELSSYGNEEEVASTGATGNRVDFYIRSSLRNAFAKRLQKIANVVSSEVEENSSETLLRLAEGTEELALEEKDKFSPVLKKWHPIAAGIASMTLHNCYGLVLQKYLADVSTLTNEAIEVLKRADKLEKDLVQVVVEDSVDCEDGGRAIIREMVPYEIDNLFSSLLKTWIDDRMKRLRECLERAKDTETWNPKSKTEPHAQSVAEIMRMARETVEDLFEIPVGISNELVMDLVEGLELVFQDYISFIASCGSKQNYIPQLPPLTRCSQHSKFIDLWKKAAPCKSGIENKRRVGPADGNHPRPSTSRGTQRLYIRLNSLYYILSHINSLDKLLVISPRQKPSVQKHESNSGRYLAVSTSFFGHALSSIQTAIQHVSEVAAYRLIFLDSNFVFYECLYLEDVVNARIRPALRILKQNLTLLCAILADKAQPLAVKEVMRATFEAFLMVLLAGGGSRIFSVADHDMIEEDFDSLKRVFCSCGEGLIGEESVEKEAETVEGVLGLMAQYTEQLVEDFSIVACEVSGLGVVGSGQKVPMPPTTGRWNRADPNTILRVLCHRNDKIANQFLKKTFQLAKR